MQDNNNGYGRICVIPRVLNGNDNLRFRVYIVLAHILIFKSIFYMHYQYDDILLGLLLNIFIENIFKVFSA